MKLIWIRNFSFSNFDFWNKFPKKVYFRSKSGKNEHHNWIRRIQISLTFSLNWQTRFFGPSLSTKDSYFQSKTDRLDRHHHWILHIQISLGQISFSLNWQFWPDFSKKGFSGLKQKNWTPHIFNIILHIQISLVPNFSSNWQFWFFRSNLPKKVFPVENKKSEHHHRVLDIWISLATKFQIRLTILNFWTKFT